MRRTISALILGAALTTSAALPALAHSFNGGGDCTTWTLKLDGLWGATRIEVDGTSYGKQLTISIPDATTATSRTFTVRWVKQGPDTVQSKTLSRDLTGCTTTTTVPETTTTVPETTTTTEVPESTTTIPTETTVPEESPTTTTPETTTTTGPSESTSTTEPPPPPTTTPAPTTTVPVYPDPTDPPQSTVTTYSTDTLPRTGVESDTLALIALTALMAGAGLVWQTRKAEDS